MKQATRAWVEKAEEDFAVALDLLDRPHPVYLNTVAFHAQQCVEKYLKARLQEIEIPFPRTHDLDGLALLLDPHLPQLTDHRKRLQWLTTYAADGPLSRCRRRPRRGHQRHPDRTRHPCPTPRRVGPTYRRTGRGPVTRCTSYP